MTRSVGPPGEAHRTSHENNLVRESRRESTRAQAEEHGGSWTDDDEAEANRQYQQYLDDEHPSSGSGSKRSSNRRGKGSRPRRAALGSSLGVPQAMTSPASTATGSLGSMLKGNSGGASVAGFLLGFGLYAVGLNYLKYGPAGARGWFAAKFFNEPFDPTTGKSVVSATNTALTSPAPTGTSQVPAGATLVSSTPIATPAQTALSGSGPVVWA